MFTLKRITTVPGTALHIMVDQPTPDSPDAGMGVGGSFHFEPAGQEGDTATVSDHTANIIMGDASLAKHFDCTPPWGAAQEDQADAVQEDRPAADEGVRPGKGRK